MVKAPFASAEAKQSTLTMSISSNDLSINIAPKATGTFGKSTSSTIGINTDNFTGYTLSIATTSSGSSVPSTSLSDADNNEIESISSSISESTFSSSSDYNNKWGYRPSQYIVTDTTNNTKTTISNNTDFLPAPTTEGDLLDITNAPNAENNTYTLDFGARVDFNLVAGNYSRTMVIMAVANDIVYNINYDENTDDTSVANMPTINPQPVTMPGQTPTAGSVATLSNSIPTRTGYNFTGWCDTATTINTTTGGQTCNSTLYNAEGDYGIDQTIDGTNIRLYATWATNEYDITFKTSTGISKIEVKQDSTTKCTIENNATNNTTGSICKLNYTIPYTIEATVATGYSFGTWNNTTVNGTIGNASLSTTTYSTGTDITTLTPTATPNTYTITLNNNGGTGGSSSTTATYDSTTLTTITNPTKANATGTRNITGFTLPSGNNADSASVTWPSSGCTSSSNCSSTNTTTYTFNGWHETSGTGTLVASNATTPVLQASTSYTDANGKWTSTSNQTLYAGWTASAGAYSSVTLPQISKTGYTCGWTTTSTGATTITYDSGSSLTPSSNTTLYGVCTANKYTLTINFAGTGVSSVQVRTSSGTGGTLMGTVSTSGGSVSGLTYNTAYYLYPVFTSGYELDNWAKTSGEGTISSTTTSNPYYTIGAGNATVTVTGKVSCVGNMQDYNASTISTLLPNVGSTASLCDSRDGQAYTVAKLADGKYWMTENLNIAGGTALSADDTDVDSSYIISFSTSNNLTKTGSTIVLPASSISGFGTANYSYVYNSGNKTNCGANGQNTPCYSYYSWDAATLGSGRSISTDNTDAEQSICPKGWKLPTSRDTLATNWQTTSDFYALAHQYGLDSTTFTDESDNGFYIQAGPGTISNFLLAGYYSNDSFHYGGSYGNYWSSTSYSDTNYARNLYFNSSRVKSADDYGRYMGMSVRCLFDTPIMQEQTASSMAALLPNVGDTATLRDRRDDQEYTVAKLADGKYWMTENLNIAGGTALSADDTDVTSAYISSFSTSNNLTKTGSTIVLPASSTSGFDTNNYSYVYNTGNKTSNCASPGCYSYYSWDAATLGSGRSIDTSDTDAPYSICPKGWKLPNSGESWKRGDFYTLATAYGANLESNSYDNSQATGSNFYNNAGPGTTPNFLLAGFYYTGSVHSGYGNYWSSTANYRAYPLSFNSGGIDVGNIEAYYGYSVRCLFDTPVMQEQTASSMATMLPNTGDTAVLKDSRDGQTYTVGKLADGKYWMTENLNIAGGTALSADDTDVDSSYISSFSTSGNLTKTGSTIVLPASSTSGFNTVNYSYAYNTGNKTSNCASPGCYSYYSWDAATLGSGRSISTDNTDAPYSICPKGWKLPTSRTTSATNWQTTSDFYALAHQYGLDSTISTYESDNGFYTQAGPGTTPGFLLAGNYITGSFNYGGSDGYYWSSTSNSYDTDYARYLMFSSGLVSSAGSVNRYVGFSVRCLFNT